jgi:hypothetical protein
VTNSYSDRHRSNGHRANSAPQGQATDPRERGYAIILRHFLEKYQPKFRRGATAFCENGRQVRMGEACCGAESALLGKLAKAADAPRDQDGEADWHKLPYFFRTWAPTAWADLLGNLSDEENSEEIIPAAQEQFRARVAAVLLTHRALGHTYHNQAGHLETKTENRTLINWCRIFGGNKSTWQDVRGHQLWARRNSETKLFQVCLRKELFAQVSGFADLAHLTATKFTQLAERYGVGEGAKARGERCILLSQEFLASVEAMPDQDRRTDEGETYAHAREEKCPNVPEGVKS